MWPFISWQDIDWSLTGVMIAAWAAVGALVSTQIWSVQNNRAQAKWRMADLKMDTLNRVTATGSTLVGLLTSHAMLTENDVANGNEFERQVREVEELKFQLLLELEKYGKGAELLRNALLELVTAKDPKGIYPSAEKLMALLSALVTIEIDGIEALTKGKGRTA